MSKRRALVLALLSLVTALQFATAGASPGSGDKDGPGGKPKLVGYTLNATTLGGGNVNVVSSPTNATATATPLPGWKFMYWLGDATGSASNVTVSLTRDKYVRAVFGTPVAGFPFATLQPQADYYPYGTIVRVTCLPPAGSYFSSWGGSAFGTNNPFSLSVTSANPSVSCLLGSLSAGQSSLTITEIGLGHVTVNPRANPYVTGQAVLLTAVPETEQNFVGWSGNTVSTQATLSLTLTQSIALTATFTKRPKLNADKPLFGLVEDGFRFSVNGPFGGNYLLFDSTNLQAWTPVGSATNPYGSVQFTDPAGTNQRTRFYRAEVLNVPSAYNLTLKNVGDTNRTVAAGTPVLVEPGNLGQAAAAFTNPPTGLSLLLLQNINDTPSNTVPRGTVVAPFNTIGTTADIFSAVQGQAATIPLMGPMPAPFNTMASLHFYIGGYGFTVQSTAGNSVSLSAIADFWPNAFQVFFNSPQNLVLNLAPQPPALGHTAGDFQVPALNRTVQVYVPDWTGTTNSVVLIGGETYYVTNGFIYTPSVKLTLPYTGTTNSYIKIGSNVYNVVTVNSPTNLSVFPTSTTPPAGTVIPAGTQISPIGHPGTNYSIGNTLSPFTVPPISSVVPVTLDTPYKGATNQYVWINNKPYQIISVGH